MTAWPEAQRVRGLPDVLELLAADDDRIDVSAVLAKANGPAPAMERSFVGRVADMPGLELLVLVPTRSPPGVVVWFSDDLGVLPGADGFETVARKLAERTGATLVLVRDAARDRSAASTPARGIAALRWAESHLADIASAGAPLAVAGNGTGGLTATSVARLARDLGRPQIALQVLVCPTMSATPSGDFRDLPPALVLTAGRDPGAPEARDFAESLAAAGNDVRLVPFPDQLHDFLSLLMVPASETGFQQIVRAVRSVLVKGSL